MIGLKAVNCQTGDPIAQEQVTAEGKEKVLNAVGDAAAKLRGRLGESLATVQKFDVPLEQATTSSLVALQAYTQAIKTMNENGAAAALRLRSTRGSARSEFRDGISFARHGLRLFGGAVAGERILH